MTHDQAKEMYDRFMRDVSPGEYRRLADMADVMADAPTDLQLLDALVEAFDMPAVDLVERLASVDVGALKEAVTP
jgi:hypothetical protein